jgi:hypothetical protein
LLHHHSSTGRDVVVASTKGLTASVCGIATETGSVLLERVTASAITGRGWVDTNGSAVTAGVTDSADNGCVAGHEGGGSQKAEGNNGGLGEVHFDFGVDCLNRSEVMIKK